MWIKVAVLQTLAFKSLILTEIHSASIHTDAMGQTPMPPWSVESRPPLPLPNFVVFLVCVSPVQFVLGRPDSLRNPELRVGVQKKNRYTWLSAFYCAEFDSWTRTVYLACIANVSNKRHLIVWASNIYPLSQSTVLIGIALLSLYEFLRTEQPDTADTSAYTWHY